MTNKDQELEPPGELPHTEISTSIDLDQTSALRLHIAVRMPVNDDSAEMRDRFNDWVFGEDGEVAGKLCAQLLGEIARHHRLFPGDLPYLEIAIALESAQRHAPH